MKNDYRYYVYDYLIGSHILTIDTLDNKFRIDRSNIYGQIFTFDKEWENITSKDIKRAETRTGYTFDKYVLEHFTDKDQFLDEKVICKSNDYNECINAIAQYCAKQEGKTLEDEDMGYYKKYLDVPENRIGNISEDGTVTKEYFRQGHIYKNFANFYRKDGICYIAENQTDKITNKSKEGKDYETYQSIYNKVKQSFELEKVNQEKYSIEDFTETIMNDLDWQIPDILIQETIDSLDNEYFEESEEEDEL